ncbi:MAG: glycosyltransferase family 2 protein [Chlamydiia bacterium]|nr:glycosyltransferase family 2 protein [Chlamydiia bacterium]
MKTSLVIPCHPAHEKHLQPLLALLEMQTETPDEVIIVAPKACVLTSTLEVRFVETADVLWPGEARNQGAKASQGDLIFFQDADDFPHPERIARVKEAFTKTPAVHVMHQWFPEHLGDPMKVLALEEKYLEMKFEPQEAYPVLDKEDAHRFPHLDWGSVAVRREVFKKVSYPQERLLEDISFGEMVMKKFGRSFVLPLPLTIYRQRLTSYPHSM